MIYYILIYIYIHTFYIFYIYMVYIVYLSLRGIVISHAFPPGGDGRAETQRRILGSSRWEVAKMQ